MSGFFSRLFGGGAKRASGDVETAAGLVERLMADLVEKAGLNFELSMTSTGEAPEEDISVEVTGEDEDLLLENEGALLDSFQLFVKRALQHHLPDSRANVSFDCRGFREEADRALVELAERLKERALEQGRAVYLRALPPKDRKVVHQHLSSDDRIRSRSVGEGLYKKIKIYPTKLASDSSDVGDQDAEFRPPRRNGNRRDASGGPGEAAPAAT